MGTNNAVLTGGGAAVVLNPEHAEIFARANMTRGDIQQGLWQATHYPKERLPTSPKGSLRGSVTKSIGALSGLKTFWC